MSDAANLLSTITAPATALDPSTLPSHFDAVAAEARWQRAWEESGIHRWDPSRPRSETFVVDTPPPTVSGSLHVGHVFSYTHQDLIVRYRRMRGWNIFYPMGWDDNGLPTERRVQNVYEVRCDPHVPFDPGLRLSPVSGKPTAPPRAISRRNFIELCHEVTAEDERGFKELFQRLSLSIDWREEYATIDDLCRGTAQSSFVKLFAAGHIYQTDAPTMWDVGFRTAVAQAEIEDREIAGAFHDVEFAVEGGGSFVIATTRPELLAACVGVAAHPDDERYRPLFGRRAITPIYRVPVPIFGTPLADPEKGTGILMVCTFGDQTDVLWWREQGLALRQVIGRDGHLIPIVFGAPGWESLDPERANQAYGEIAIKGVPAARRIVSGQLAEASASALAPPDARPPLRSEPRPIKHSVKFFEKGDHPLEIVTSRQWFVRLMDKKERLIETGRRIHWSPAHMQKRFENWTMGLLMDWCISRQRYFGVPIPIWYPLDGSGVCQFDRPMLPRPDRLPVDPMSEAPEGYDEGRRDKPLGFTAEVDVFDTWFTSGLTPQIGARWIKDQERFARLFPMDVRPQSHEIIRTWAFYTIAKAMLHEGKPPWGNVLISGWVLDPDRKKMSKSKGNVTTPIHLLEKYGSDSVRYWSAGARLGTDTMFDERVIQNGKRLVTKLWNAGKFVLLQSAAEGGPEAITRELDRAFVAELRKVIGTATASFEEFEFAPALEAVESFFWQGFTDNYLELVKRRARSESDLPGRASAVATLRLGLATLLRLFAPVLPIIGEELWALGFAPATGRRFLQQVPWPTIDELAPIPGPDGARSFAIACAAVGAVRKARTAKGIGLAAPLSHLTIFGRATDVAALPPVLADVRDASQAPEPVLEERPTGSEDETLGAEIETA